MTDAMDAVLSQAVVCAYAVPGAGAVLAGGISIFQALLGGGQAPIPESGYSWSDAIADLGRQVSDEFTGAHIADQLATIGGWQAEISQTMLFIDNFTESGPVDRADQHQLAAQIEQDFVDNRSFNKLFADIATPEAGTEEMVKALGHILMARTTYHSLCQAKLAYQARAEGELDPDATWTAVRSRIRPLLEDSLDKAITYTKATVMALDDAVRNGEDKAWAHATLADLSSLPKNPEAAYALGEAAQQSAVAAFTTELRRLRAGAHFTLATGESLTADDVVKYIGFIDAFEALQALLKKVPLLPQAPTGSAPTGSGTGAVTTLPPRPSGVARFLYESDPVTGWVNVVGDSAVSSGGLAAQNAGSTSAKLYYQFGGDPVNGTFAAQLTAAGQFAEASLALKNAYDAKYGAGAFDADGGPNSTQTRLTSLLVPLDPGSPPIGNSVYAVLYSVGPQLRGRGIEDEAAYKAIYADAFDAVADWNHTYPQAPITTIRLILLSTGIYAGTADPTLLAALRTQAAGLVIDAVKEATAARPTLAGTTFLVNTNDLKGGVERAAFDAAAQARRITVVNQGFDVPLS